MKFLLILSIIIILSMGIASNTDAQNVPDWVKNTAGWWATDAISENEFVNAIEFLINDGIIQVQSNNECVDYFLKHFEDKSEIVEICKTIIREQHEEIIPYNVEIDVNSHGFRGPEFSESKSSEIYRIIVLGGSTIHGAETTYDTTIPGIMQKIFDSQNIEKKIQVINAGISGGNTISELELIKSKIVNYEPDLLIMYDGWNNLSADFPVDGTINNYELICEQAIDNNINLIITLQPIAGFGNKTLTLQEKINSLTGEDHNGFQLIQSRSTYDFLVREMAEFDKIVEQHLNGVCSVHDLRSVFDEVSGSIYWDQGHMLHAGNFIIAEEFFELSMKHIDSEFFYEKKFTPIISNYNNIPTLQYLFNKIGIEDNGFQHDTKDVSSVGKNQGKYFQIIEEFGDIELSFVGKDFSGLNINKIKITGEDLTGADLTGQDFRNVDLTGTIIRGADLSFANLEGKDLSGMDLRGINFSNANLKNVIFEDAGIGKTIQISMKEKSDCFDDDHVINLIKGFDCVGKVIDEEEIRTKFTNADLTNSKFGTTVLDEMQVITFTDFSYADLTNSDITNVRFMGCDFQDTTIDNITLDNVYFTKANLNDVQGKSFDFNVVLLHDSSLINAKLTNGQIEMFVLKNSDLSNTDFTGTNIITMAQIQKNNLSCKNNDICEN